MVAAAQRRAVPGPAHKLKLISADACVTRHAVTTRTVTSWVHRASDERLHATASHFQPAASAPGLGRPLPHLCRDSAHPCRICPGTGLTHATSVPRLGSPQHICAATGLSQELIAYALSIPEAFATAMLKRLDANGDEQLDASELKPLPAGIKKVACLTHLAGCFPHTVCVLFPVCPRVRTVADALPLSCARMRAHTLERIFTRAHPVIGRTSACAAPR